MSKLKELHNSDSRVPVIDAYGEFGMIKPEQFERAVKENGYRIPTEQELNAHVNQLKHGDSAGRAFLEGAASSATFGLSDIFQTQVMGVPAEDLKAREELNPTASFLGKGAGILGAIAAPEIGIAKGASSLARMLNPVKEAARVGKAVTKAVTPAIEKALGNAISAEARPLAHAVLSQAGAHALGSGVEAAAYGLGETVHEYALGDPAEISQKLLANVGFSAAIGGGFGALLGGGGAGFSGAKKLLKDAVRNTLDTPIENETFVDMIKRVGANRRLEESGAKAFSKKEEESVIKGLTELKPNAKEIIQSAETIGAPLMEGQISNSAQVHRFESNLTKSPSITGAKRQQQYQSGYNKAVEAAKTAVRSEADMSLAEVGEVLQESIGKKIEAEYAPISKLYEEIKTLGKEIPINPDKLKNIEMDVIFDRSLQNTDFHEGKKIAEGYLKDLTGFQNVDQLKRFKTYIYDRLPETASKLQKKMAAQVYEIVDRLERDVILEYADSFWKNEPKQLEIKALIKNREVADAAYKQLMEETKKVKGLFNKRKVAGPRDFINYITEEITPERFASKLFSKENAKFLDFFTKKFPEEAGLLVEYKKAELLKNASKFKSGFNPTTLFKSIEDLPKETRTLLFSPEELKLLNASKTYIESIPKDVNPSSTNMAHQYSSAFSVKGIINNAKDALLVQPGIKYVTEKGLRESGLPLVRELGIIERSIAKTTDRINQSSKSLFNTVEKTKGLISKSLIPSDSEEEKTKTYDRFSKELGLLVNNPEAMLDVLQEKTQSLYEAAPDTAGHMQQQIIAGSVLLASKLKQGSAESPFFKPFKPSKSDISSFYKTYEILNDPFRIYRQITTGAVSQESMQSLTTVYPQLLSQMRQSILEQMMTKISKNETIDYKMKLSLSKFLGMDLDRSLNPQFMLSVQTSLMNRGQEQARSQMQAQGKISKDGVSKINQAQREYTPAQATALK